MAPWEIRAPGPARSDLRTAADAASRRRAGFPGRDLRPAALAHRTAARPCCGDPLLPWPAGLRIHARGHGAGGRRHARRRTSPVARCDRSSGWIVDSRARARATRARSLDARMNVLLIASRYPWPPYSGDRLRTAIWVDALASDASVTLVAPGSNREEASRQSDVHFIPARRSYRRAAAALGTVL